MYNHESAQNGHLTSTTPIPQRSHETTESGDAPMYGMFVLMVNPLSLHLKVVMCSLQYLAVPLQGAGLVLASQPCGFR